MKTKILYSPASIFLILAALGFLTIVSQTPKIANGSINAGQEYPTSTSTTTPGTATYGSNATTTKLCVPASTGYCALGSVTISSTTPDFGFSVYDSAVGSTTAYSGAGTATSTLLATFPKNAPAGTYTFDMVVQRGIVIAPPAGFNGVLTITSRKY